jgi:hypothetical protein
VAIKFSPEVEAAIPSLDAVDEMVKFGCRAAQFDAVNTLVVARQLETVSRRVIEIEYPQFKSSTFIPVNNEMGEQDEWFTYRVWDGQTMAKIVGNYSTDYPLVNADVREYTVQAFKVGNAYMYSVDDLRKAQRAGISLDTRLAQQARLGHEIAKEDVAAIGQPEKGVYGLTNHPNVPVVTLPTGAWTNPATTGLQILADLNYMVTQMRLNTNEVLEPDTLLLPINLYRALQIKLISSTGDNASNMSVLQMFQAQNPGITVASWNKLLNQVVLYRRDPSVLEFISITDFEQFTPEYRALTWTIACRSAMGGVVIYQPQGVMYAYLGG